MPDAAEQFYSALQSKAMAAVGSILHGTLYPVEYPAQGDFAWNWQNASGVFNQQTYDYVSARVRAGQTPGTVALDTSGSFGNAYVQLLNGIAFSFSPADQDALSKAQNNASIQAATVVSDYQTTIGPITNTQLLAAGYTNPIDYVIGYVLGSQWSGASTPLTYAQMAAARNLAVLLPRRPMSSDQVITDVGVYLSMMQSVTTLLGLQQNGAWTLSQLRTNAMTPTLTNGGMTTFSPQNGTTSTALTLPWAVNQPVASINNDLANVGRTISLSMETTQGSGNSLSVNVEGHAAAGIGSLLRFDAAASGSYDMSQAQGTSTEASVEMMFRGYSVVPLSPLAWNEATNAGWYSTDPVAQAVANHGKEVTGFKFVTEPPFELGPITEGGELGLLTALLIANYPDITITYQHADFAAFKQAWSEQVSGNLTLFGAIPLGGFSEGAYGSTYAESSDNSTFTVTFSASPAVTSVPQYQRTAYVVGGVVATPGAPG